MSCYHVGSVCVSEVTEEYEKKYGIEIHKGMHYDELLNQLIKAVEAKGGVKLKKTDGYFASYWINVDKEKTKLDEWKLKKEVSAGTYYDYQYADFTSDNWNPNYKVTTGFGISNKDKEAYDKARMITYARIPKNRLADELNILLTGYKFSDIVLWWSCHQFKALKKAFCFA